MEGETPDPRLARAIWWARGCGILCFGSSGLTVLVIVGGETLASPWNILVTDGRDFPLTVGGFCGFVGMAILGVARGQLLARSTDTNRAVSVVSGWMLAVAGCAIAGAPPVWTLGADLLERGSIDGASYLSWIGAYALAVGAASAVGLALHLRAILESHAGPDATVRQGPTSDEPAPATLLPAARMRLALRRVGRTLLFVPVVLALFGGPLLWLLEGDVFKDALARNEERAVETLAQLQSAQSTFRADGYVDLDADGSGEFGFLDELLGVRPVRRPGASATTRVPRGFLRGGHRRLGLGMAPAGQAGVFGRSGYLFVVYLPTAAGTAVCADSPSRPSIAADAPHQADRVAAYAWPIQAGLTGRRAFFIGDYWGPHVTGMEQTVYSGLARPPSPDAGFSPAGLAPSTSPIWPANAANLYATLAGDALGRSGIDGNLWRPVGE